MFNASGSPALLLLMLNVSVNGQNLGVYTPCGKGTRPFLDRAFSNQAGVLYEATLVDFLPGWSGSFEHKLGSGEMGRKKIQQLIDVLHQPTNNIEAAIGKLVDLDSFYTFWAVEGLLGFWDRYSGNRNNFFIYLNPEMDKFLGVQIVYSKNPVELRTTTMA